MPTCRERYPGESGDGDHRVRCFLYPPDTADRHVAL
jgi:hypothetical protein